MVAAAQVSSRTTAACSGCSWTSDPLTNDSSIRVAARQHSDLTQHPVAVLTNTITVLEPTRVTTVAAVAAEAGAR